jgi:hypothetical protein
MKSWALNRRGFTHCASAALLLFILASSSLLLFPDNRGPIPSSDNSRYYYSDKAPSEESPLLSSSAPQSTLPAWNSGPSSPTTLPPVARWTFNSDRDERNFGLTEEQCSVAFPNFYTEIDRAVQYRKDKGFSNVTNDLVDIAWRPDEIMRAMIYNKQV